uniref:MORN repeat-containing protein 3 n=1 Tax=Culex tarsalis TaxID=7177 RepID=A0A1Q3FTS5_CULTA
MSARQIRSFFTATTHYQGEADCQNRRSGVGQQVQRNGLLYEGSWKDGLRHGHGIVYRKEPGTTDLYVKIYVGAWEDGRKHGFGVKYYKRGKYVGFWRQDQRSGRGFMWFDSGNFYMGHWQADRFHGLGILLEGRTGNLYQGEFRGGKKHGEGMYVHSRTGQIKRGFWTEGVFRTGTLEDFNRNQVLWPTIYPIPEIKLVNFPEVFEEWMDQYSKALQI